MKGFRFNSGKIKKIKRQKSEHSRTSKKLIIFIICAIFIFTGLAMWIQLKSGIELSSTLITCFYAFCTGELWMLASIKKSKLRSGQKGSQYQIKDNERSDDEPLG